MSEPTSSAVIHPIIPPIPGINFDFRRGLSLAGVTDSLGLLADLAGTWIGTGFNLISLPDFDSMPPSTGPAPFRLKLNATVEILEFTPVGAAVPNRGATQGSSGQKDINIFALRYLQRITDAVTHEPLHIEPGLWLNVPKTEFPALLPTVVRQGTIPHGNSLLAVGTAFPSLTGLPRIDDVDSTPTKNPNTPPPLTAAYLAPFVNPPLPPGFQLPFVKNPNLALRQAISGQKIIKTVVLLISTTAPQGAPAAQVGGIVNMPFDITNANATRLDAVFWIETVQQSDGSTFLQLQYTQTVILNFLAVDWPHISVATLVKQ
ncbi:MAG: heme-binding protein [Pseudonocardiaceae bacterium]